MRTALALRHAEIRQATTTAPQHAAADWSMTPGQIALVRATFQVLTTDRDRFAEMFYARVVALDPQIRRHLLPSNMVAQRLQLLLTLSEIVQQLDDLPRLAQTLGALSQQHGLFGAGDPKFHTARAALLWSMERILDPGPESSIHQAWDRACTLVEGLLGGCVPLRHPQG